MDYWQIKPYDSSLLIFEVSTAGAYWIIVLFLKVDCFFQTLTSTINATFKTLWFEFAAGELGFPSFTNL